MDASISSGQPESISLDEHLSYPVFSQEQDGEQVIAKEARQTLQDRLYVGNLHPSVDELHHVLQCPGHHLKCLPRYALLQIFSKFGRITKLDFLFHKTGALKGKPRGFAFVEYGSSDDALRALGSAHDKLVRGRRLVVTFAQQAPLDPATGLPKARRSMAEAGRPTTLSMIKSGAGSRHGGTHDKIAMMEAKLRQMERAEESESLVHHPSLPLKPLPSDLPVNPGLHSTDNAARQRQTQSPLPMPPKVPPPLSSSTISSNKAKPAVRKAGALTGIKFGKPKPKAEEKSS
ncbi:unnamed protein product [Mycena citricolor]|uniref:RRM domain-containing protein n=1 Tax=Mycena citricolor TaxID=2018698 RepID=A0AAD2Q2P1_9AGAR|nr:unnamed protein product [Mycena citricolor]